MTALKRIRQNNKLSTNRLAGLTGVCATELLNAENGHAELDRDDQLAVAGFFGMDRPDLFDRDGRARKFEVAVHQ